MWTQLLVFVSSTSDLREEREAIASALPGGFSAYLYETDRARRASPEEHLLQIISQSEVFTCILGGAYGSVYPGCEKRASIVEWEFDTARKQEKLELMTYVKRLPREEVDADQFRFREKVVGFQKGVWKHDFDTTEELVGAVRDDLLMWLAEFYRRVKAEEMQASAPGPARRGAGSFPWRWMTAFRDESPARSVPQQVLRFQRRLLTGTAGFAAAATVIVFIHARFNPEASSVYLVAGMGTLSIVAIAGCMLLSKLFLGGLRDVVST